MNRMSYVENCSCIPFLIMLLHSWYGALFTQLDWRSKLSTSSAQATHNPTSNSVLNGHISCRFFSKKNKQVHVRNYPIHLQCP
jgi:hypothetical protein